jgi:hypothetical protein
VEESPKAIAARNAALESIQQAAVAKKVGRRTVPPSDPEFPTRWPALFAWMTFDFLPNGYQKQPSTVQVKVDNGDFRVTLQDQATEQALTALSATLEGCWDALERALVDPNAKWQVWQSKEKLRGPKENGKPS